jgi:hypothetical protein
VKVCEGLYIQGQPGFLNEDFTSAPQNVASPRADSGGRRSGENRIEESTFPGNYTGDVTGNEGVVTTIGTHFL